MTACMMRVSYPSCLLTCMNLVEKLLVGLQCVCMCVHVVVPMEWNGVGGAGCGCERRLGGEVHAR
jgi:hypothetical protein